MTPEQQDLLHKAISSLEAAKVLLASEFPEIVEELYDVAVPPGVRRPMALGFITNEIQRMITVGHIDSNQRWQITSNSAPATFARPPAFELLGGSPPTYHF